MAERALRWGKRTKQKACPHMAECGDGEQKALEKVRPPSVCQTI
jgi:hypothetical protein